MNLNHCMRIAILIMAVFWGCPAPFFAQRTMCTLSGKVSDESRAPIAYASVAVYDDNMPITGVVTDGEGKFLLKVAEADRECRLVVEFVGYGKYQKAVTLNTSHIDLGQIILKEDIIALHEVVVTAKETVRKSTVEHTTINASANMASGTGTAIDILRTSSSVGVSNGEISIRGNSNILVLMDGVPTTASDLSTIPAANVKSIEVITNPDASHDAGGTGGIINIISKKSHTTGFSGMASGNFSSDGGVTGNVALSYNRPKASWRFGYNVKYEDDEVNSTLNRRLRSSGYEVFQRMNSIQHIFNNHISMGAEFRIDPRNRLSVDAKAIIPRLNVGQNIRNAFSDRNGQREESRYNDVTWNRENIEGSVAYTRIVKPEISELVVRGSVSKIWGHRPSYYSVDGTMVNRSHSGGSPFIPALQADYTYKFKAGTLSAGAKLTYRRNDIYHEFYELAGDDWHYSESLSNDLLHTELIPAAYAMFASRVNKKFSYKAGLRGEFSTVTLNSGHDAVDERKNSFFLAPSLSGTYALTRNQELSLALSRRIGRPTYPQLNPYMSMVDATTYEQGNMHLKPEQTTKLDVGYSLRGEGFNLFVNGYVNYTADYISQITKLAGERLVTTYVNAESDLKAGVELSLKVIPAKWMNLSVGANSYYVTTQGTFEGTDIANNGWTNNSNLMLDFLPWKGGDIQLQYSLTTPQYYPQLTTSFTHRMDVGFKQRLLKGTMTLSLLFTDVLDTAKWEVWSHNNLFDLRNVSKEEIRMVWLGVSYNFNSFKQKKGSQKSDENRSLIRLGL